MEADGGVDDIGTCCRLILTLFFVPAGYFLLFRFSASMDEMHAGTLPLATNSARPPAKSA